MIFNLWFNFEILRILVPSPSSIRRQKYPEQVFNFVAGEGNAEMPTEAPAVKHSKLMGTAWLNPAGADGSPSP